MKNQGIFEKPVFEVKPVSWTDNGETPLKFQAQVTVVRPNGEKKTLVGDPAFTKEAAKNSLAHELYQRLEDVQNCVKVLEDLDNV